MKVSNNFAAFQFESGTGYPGWAPHPLGPLLPRRGEGEVLGLGFRENAPSFGLVLQGGSGLPGMAPHPLGPLLPRRGEGEVLCLDFRENAPSFGFVLGGGSGLPGEMRRNCWTPSSRLLCWARFELVGAHVLKA